MAQIYTMPVIRNQVSLETGPVLLFTDYDGFGATVET